MIKITENPGDFWRRKILRSYKIRVIKIMILEQRDKKGHTNCPVEQNWDLEVDTHMFGAFSVWQRKHYISMGERRAIL